MNVLLASLALAADTATAAALAALLPGDPAGPGCAVDVRRRGIPVAALTVGQANLETPAPITAQTVFEAGSVAKQFIGAGVALLAARGSLGLDDPIRRWLPELPPCYAGVTVRMLVNHTSGIRSWNNLAELTGRGEDETCYDNRWVLRAVARQRRLDNRPGREYLYSNSTFVLAAIIVERAAGGRLDAFYRKAFFDRLGLAHRLQGGRARPRPSLCASGRRRVAARHAAERCRGRGRAPVDGRRPAAVERRAGRSRAGRPGVGRRPADARAAVVRDAARLRHGRRARRRRRPPGDQPRRCDGVLSRLARALPRRGLSVAMLCNDGAVDTEELGPRVAALYLPAAATGGDAPAPAAGSPRRPLSLASTATSPTTRW